MTATRSQLRRRAGTAAYLLARSGRRAVQHLDPLRDPFDRRRSRHVPADIDDLTGYQERFFATARLFELFLRRCTWPASGPDAGDPVAVVILPWYATPVPWYAIAVGLGLARRGRRVEFVWHDLRFSDPTSAQVPQHAEIERIVRRLARRFPVTRLSALPDAARQEGDDELLDRLARDNVTWTSRGEVPSDTDLELRRQVRAALAVALPKVRTLYGHDRYASSITSGGMIGPSGLYLREGKAAGVRTATFDAGLGNTAVDVDGPATQHPDHVQSFAWLAAQDDETRAAAVTAAQEEYDRRRSGLDPDRYQVSKGGGGRGATAGSVLIPLSVLFDQAALAKHHIFANTAEWLVATVRTLLAETDDEIVVRQHPSERRLLERSTFDPIALLRSTFGTVPQLRLVPAEEAVSTYDLLEPSRLVLPFVSTIGIEAAALGKPVILSGTAYYAPLGFVRAPQTRDDYLQLVARGARGELGLLPDQVDLAWRSYYLSAVCHRVWTSFTPQPSDFWRWVARDPGELFDDPDVGDILTALGDGTPLALLQHARIRAASPSPDELSR